MCGQIRDQTSPGLRAAGFDARNVRAFRARYLDGDNFVVTDDTVTSYVRNCRGVAVRFVCPI